MDLLATVRKEGSRGGAGDFKWSDVQNSTRREHYLGHSLMAPVGRWSKGRDLNWYAKGDGSNEDGEDPAEKAARERKEEIKHIKEAEEDALARALGLPVPDRHNANMEPVSNKRQTDGLLAETTIAASNDTTRAKSNPQDEELQSALKEYKRRHRHDDRRDPHADRDHDHDRARRHHKSSRDRDTHRIRHRDERRDRQRKHRSRSRSPTHRHERYRDRPRSPAHSPSHSRRK